MDIILEATNDFQDWELIQPTSDSESDPAVNSVSCDDAPIQLNYFSLDAPREEVFDDDKSGHSDNPSWIDPGLEEDNHNRYLHKDAGEFWSDSSSEPSEDLRKSGEFDGNQTGFSENEKKEMIFGKVIDKKEGEKLGNFYSDSSGIELASSAKTDDFVKENSDVGVEGNVSLHHGSDVLAEGNNENGSVGEVIDDTGNKNSGGELGKRSLVWWKMPMEFLRYFVFRMSPVWTISVAAAAMGFVILGRRLYTMKKKTKGLQIKVTVDDKKVSQVMSRAARLNEAFSVVKRVPVIRPSLPAIGVTPWPVMSLR